MKTAAYSLIQPFIWMMLVLLLISLFLFLRGALSFILTPRRRWPFYKVRGTWKRRRIPRWVFKILKVPDNGRKIQEKTQLLTECGFGIGAAEYMAVKRMLLIVIILMDACFFWFGKTIGAVEFLPFPPAVLFLMAQGVLVLLLGDQAILEAIRKRRKRRIVQEIYVISHQLLYYSGSKMNLHSKLKRCLSFSSVIRKDLERLLNEWYTDPEMAISRFKRRVGTDEGYSFAETLNSLRLFDTPEYYDLLRKRIQDYKEQIELAKESRKETLSYILFVLAGIPILYTFRVFMYPWMAESQKLFDALN